MSVTEGGGHWLTWKQQHSYAQTATACEDSVSSLVNVSYGSIGY